MIAVAVAVGSVLVAMMAASIGWPGAALVLLALVTAATVIVSFGATVGVDNPRFAANAFCASAVGALSMSSAFGALAIWLVSLVTIWKGPSASAWTDALAGGILAAIAAGIDPKGILARWLPAKVSARLVQRKYGASFPTLDTVNAVRGDAYKALNWDRLGDENLDLVGWGRDATERRLILIDKGLKDLGV